MYLSPEKHQYVATGSPSPGEPWKAFMLFVTDCQSPFTFSTLILLSSDISTFRVMQSLHTTLQGRPPPFQPLLCKQFTHWSTDLFILIPAWIMPDLKQSILQTVAKWAGSMTYWGSNCPLMVTETESPVWSMPQRWPEIPKLAWEKT